MNPRINIRYACILVSLFAANAHTAESAKVLEEIAAAMSPEVVMLTRDGRKILYSGREPQSYRVCVKRERDSGVMKVISDGKVTLLHPGDCDFVFGKRIVAMPSEPLAPNARIVATFEKD